MNKICSWCGVEKPISEFNLRSGKPRSYCKECHRADVLEWQRNNREKRWVITRRYDLKNRADLPRKYPPAKTDAERLERRRIAKKKWRDGNKEKMQECRDSWNNRNQHKLMARVRKYQASKLTAAPQWANYFFIEEIYDLAVRRTKATGFAWEVDHIVPLVSPLVCGLHCEQNLRVIPASVNRSKGNRHWPDMP